LNVYQDYIFYSNYDQDGFVYRTHLDGSGKIALTTEPGKYINIADNRLYYFSEVSGEYKATYRIHPNGTQKETVNYRKDKKKETEETTSITFETFSVG
jgi:hypothetical protein